MKKENHTIMASEEIKKDPENHNTEQGISRRTAIRKMGYAAFASSTMLLLLNNPTKAQTNSEDPGDAGEGWEFGNSDDGNKNNSRDYGSYDWD